MRTVRYNWIGVTASFFAAMLGISTAFGQQITKFDVVSGTVEFVDVPEKGILFRWDKDQQLYYSDDGGGGEELTGVGFKLENGRRYFVGEGKNASVNELAARENPGVKPTAYLMRSPGRNIVEIKLTGQTAVYRVKLWLSWSTLTLWANRRNVNDSVLEKKRGEQPLSSSSKTRSAEPPLRSSASNE